ncbi:MAG: hypothetical protein V1797_08755 [Pseudomonadota bacterium]
MLQITGSLHNLRSTQIVGGNVACGSDGPHITDIALTYPLVHLDHALVRPLFKGTSFAGYSSSGDYYKWGLVDEGTLRVEVLRTMFNTTSLAKQFWEVTEYLQCRGKVVAATTITGNTAADFDVTISPPAGARLTRTQAALSCQPLDNQGNYLRVGLSLPDVNTVRFGVGSVGGNTSKPVQAELLFF